MGEIKYDELREILFRNARGARQRRWAHELLLGWGVTPHREGGKYQLSTNRSWWNYHDRLKKCGVEFRVVPGRFGGLYGTRYYLA